MGEDTVKPDGFYYELSKEIKLLLRRVVEYMVTKKESANVAQVRSGHELEVLIGVAQTDEWRITPYVCFVLEILLFIKTGVTNPVVRLASKRDPEPTTTALQHAA